MRGALLWLTVVSLALGAEGGVDRAYGKPVIHCNTGWTGSQCENPMCTTTKTLYHHIGDADQGDTIEYGTSTTCNGVMQFPVDQYFGETYITLGTATGRTYPTGILTDPNGNEVLETSIQEQKANLYVISFQDLYNTNGAGKYTFTFKSGGSASCYYLIQSKTKMVVDGGFVIDPFDDYVITTYPDAHMGVNRMPRENVSSYFAFGASTLLAYPGEPSEVTISMSNEYDVNLPVKRRYGCKANAFVGPYKCPVAGRRGWLKIRGFDSQGHDFQRTYQLQCLANGASPTASVSPPTECLNGGIMINGSTANAECYCGQFFEGNSCEYKRCFNDGEVGINNVCQCETGYTGTYCQDVHCSARSETTFDLSVRALTFVVRATNSMVAQLLQIVEAANKIQAYMKNFSPYFIKYNLVVVANGVLVDFWEYDTFEKFLQALQNIQPVEDGQCDDSLFMALSATLNLPSIASYKRSPIFVFSDGLSDDNQNTGLTLLHQLAYYRGQVFFMLTDSVMNRCKIDMAAEGYRTMRYIAWFTHGLVTHVPVDDLSEATRSLVISTYRTNYLLTNDLLDSCNRAPKYQAFFVDENVQYFYVIGTGTGLHLQITNPDRNVYIPEIFYQGGNNTYIWYIPNRNLMKGSYLISMTADGAHPCHYRVLGRGDYDLFVGISSKITYDAKMQQPVMNEESHIVAHINGVTLPSFQDIHAEATIWTNEGESDTRTVLYASNGYLRDECDFFLYFGAWTCTSAYQFFYINVYITDRSGFNLQRTATGYCSTIDVTPSPQDGCLNGGIRVNNTCLCPAQWNGDRCQTIRCLNDGSIVADTTCVCVAGYSGTYCEKIACYTLNEDAEKVWSPNGRSISFLIHTSIPTRSTIRAIRQAASRLVQDIKGQHPSWISNYQVVRFNHDQIMIVSDSPDPNDFLQGINTVVDYSMRSEVSCGDLQVMQAIMTVLESPSVTDKGIIYVFLDGYMAVNVALLSTLYDRLEITRVQVNVAMLAESPCGHTLTEPASTNLMNIVGFSGGQWIMVMPSNAAPVVSMIPSLYRSSYIYENFVTDCTTPQTFYFPVDSQMQAFTSYVVGEMPNTQPLYYDPTGAPFGTFNVWTDVGLGSRLDQIIQQCDSGWDLRDNHCWQYNFDALDWYTARNRCHSQGAVLSTVYNQVEQDFLDMLAGDVQYWTGLNDVLQHGSWVWDQIGDTPLSLNLTQYTNWGPNQPDLNTVQYQCVAELKQPRGWFNIDCNSKYFFVCMKPAYNVDFEPSSTSIDLLPRGIWKAVLQTSEGPCYIQIFGQSGIQVYDLYAIDGHSDVGDPQPHSKANDNRIIAHTTNQQLAGQGIEGQLQYAHLYTMNLTIIQAQTFEHRDSELCAFEYISTGFRCPDYTFQTLTTGIDRFGYLYQRIQPVKCLSGPTSQADCFNGGIFYNGRCVCAPQWDGELCETRKCVFGKKAAISSQCECYYGYIGDFCETPTCTRTFNSTVASPDNKTFVLLLDGGLPADIAAALQTILTAVITSEQGPYPNWFSHYTGVVFRDSSMGTAALSTVLEYDTPAEFVTAMIAEATQAYTPTTGSRAIVSAILKALVTNANVVPRSPIFILTASNAEDYAIQDLAFYQIALKHAYIYPIIIGDTGPPGGATDYTAPEVGVLYDLSYISGGRMYQIAATALDVQTFWVSTMTLLYNSYYVSSVQRTNCTGMTEYIQIGANSSSIIVDVYASVPHNVLFVDADQNTVPALVAASSQTNTLILGTTIGEPGLWKVTINPTVEQPDEGICSIAVRGVSTMDIFIAFSHDTEGDLHADSAELFPITGVGANKVVAQTNGGKLYFAQIFSTNERTLRWASPLIARRRCSYTYISLSSFTCVEESLAVAVDGEDYEGHPFRRMIHVHCVGSIPTPTPGLSTITPESTLSPSPTTPLPTCDPSVPRFDTVIILDSSETMRRDGFVEVVDWLRLIPEHVLIGQNNNRFMLGYYSSATEFFPLEGDFNGINNTLDYMRVVDLLETYGFTGGSGNNVYSIFDSINPGAFREGDVQRFIIFFSTTSWKSGGFTDPTSVVKGFRNGGINVMPIGYGPLAKEDELSALGCVKMVANRNELDNLMPWIVSMFCRTDQFC